MGFDVQCVKFLLGAQRSGVRFNRTAVLGRQQLFIDPASLRRLLGAAGMVMDDAGVQKILTQNQGFAEPLLRLLGAEEVWSVDASPYEGATVVHDLNQPVPSHLVNAFSAVIDAGTLEHIFDFPRAIRNCMEMVQEGGHLLLITPANNFMGHGFYQFSPELFFRVCSEANGFTVNRLIVCGVDADAPWYQVVDPARAGRRVELLTSRPAYLLVQATKQRQVPVLTSAPQQSDYTALWQKERSDGHAAGRRAPALRVLRGIGRRLGVLYRSLEPPAIAARRQRPDQEVFTEVHWLPGAPAANPR
jgi:hypothetical protein